ncbi:DNA fragmentation factor subunit beta-like [Babylonia areolata]|uniref:DNA fragmentation factor subunit beta-like n=1 Tax=Babylonia areolata TaxID=304850 RepID=UPI003FD24F0C
MLSRFMSLFNGGMRAYKVQNSSRDKRVGVTAKSLQDLVAKGREKLQIPEDEEVSVVIEDDGTLVDSEAFFKKLPSQTVFIFLQGGEKWKGAGDLIYDALNQLHMTTRRAELADQIRELLTDEKAPEKISMMSQYLDMLEVDVESEQRYEDEDWFDGLNKKYKTKSEVMRNSAQQRIRSYYISAKEQIQKEADPSTKPLVMDLLEELNAALKSNDFHGSYFDRRATKQRLCDKKGWFKCQGAYDQESCDKKHMINPYASRGYRQLFGLWNLDHIVEKSREVIPTLLEAARTKPKYAEMDWQEAYRLLFTLDNLKLVQVGCHKKAARAEHKCRAEDFFIT